MINCVENSSSPFSPHSLKSYIYWGDPGNSLLGAIFNYAFCRDPQDDDVPPTSELAMCMGGMFDGHYKKWAALAWILIQIALWFAVAGVLHHYRWYWAL